MREVPQTYYPRKLPSQATSCELMLEMFVDLNLSQFFDCPHNTTQFYKIINFMFVRKEKEIENAKEERYKEKTTATMTTELKRSTSEVLVSVRLNEAGLNTRWRSQPLDNKTEEHSVSVVDPDKEALRRVLKKEIPKTHRPGKVMAYIQIGYTK